MKTKATAAAASTPANTDAATPGAAAIQSPAAGMPPIQQQPSPSEAPGENLTLSQLASSFSRKRPKPGGRNAADPKATAAAAPTNGQPPSEPAAADVSETEVTEAAAGMPPIQGEETEIAATDEQPAGEEQEDGGGNAADPDDADTDPETDVPKAVKQLKKSVHRLSQQRDELQAALTKANALIEQMQGGEGDEGGRNAADPNRGAVNGHPVLREIDAQLDVIDEALTFAEDNPDGGEWTDPKTGKVHNFDTAQVKRMRRNAERVRTELLADKAAASQELRRAQAEQARVLTEQFGKAYPALAKKDSPQAIEFHAFTRNHLPNIEKFLPAGWQLFAADAFAGSKARLAAAKAAAIKRPGAAHKPISGGTEPANVVTHPAAAAPRATEGGAMQSQIATLEKQFAATGDQKVFAQIETLKRRARLQARAAA